jgi:hypothetical protein
VPGIHDYSSAVSATVPHHSEDQLSDAETIADENEVFHIYGDIKRVHLSCASVSTFLLK